MKSSARSPWFALALATFALSGCTGPKGDSGPMGPSGPSAPNTSPIYYYNQDFDSPSYSVSEWQTNAAGGMGSFGPTQTTSEFQSPPDSLRINYGASTAGAMCWVPLESVDTSKDTWVECDWMLGSLYDEQIALNANNGTRLVMGYSSVAGSMYLVNSGSPVYVLSAPTVGVWHHVKMVLYSNGLSSYWFDSLALGSKYSTDLALGSEANNALGLRIGSNYAGSTTYIDNLQCYHY